MVANSSTASDAPGPEAYLQHPAVIIFDWIGFFSLFGSACVLVYKLMSFRGPNHQPEYYFFGYCIEYHFPFYI